MLTTFTASVRDGLSNLAASLGAGKDKAAADAFMLHDLSRAEIEAMYRGDWLARKVVDIVPADMCREWRQWSGERADVARMEAAERRLGLRRAVQRAMVLGRLYGGGAIVIGTGEMDPAALARPLDPLDIRPGDLRFLHVVSRWQLGTPGLDRDPLSPWYGEAECYEVMAPGRGALVLHPSRVVRFLGNPWPDPSVAPTPWSDSVLQALYDAVHAVALTMAGATSLMHEAKVDVVTVPNLSEHLSSAETTAQLSARFGYAAAMKSINNLLLLGDGETWNRQKVDFAGLPEMVRTFLQVAAGAADIPVTRLMGQSPAGLSATGESDTRNYYDMIAARQELEIRPALERLDRVIAASEGIDPGALTFAFRPLWQLDAASAATIALQKAQATQVYAGLNLWPTATTARLVEAQLAEDGTYPNVQAVFRDDRVASAPTYDFNFNPAQLRNKAGEWTIAGSEGSAEAKIIPASLRTGANPQSGSASLSTGNSPRPSGQTLAQETDPEEGRRAEEFGEPQPGDVLRVQRFNAALEALRAVDPANGNLNSLEPPGYIPTEADIARVQAATEQAKIAAGAIDPSSGPLPNPQTEPELPQHLDLPESVRKALYPEIQPGPPGVVITVTGRTAQERGYSYEAAIFDQFGLVSPDESWRDAGLKPDGVGEKQIGEAKYTDAFAASIYNPDLKLPFEHGEVERVIQQASNYRKFAPDPVLTYYTNDLDMGEYLVRRFRSAAISNFRVIIVPATRG